MPGEQLRHLRVDRLAVLAEELRRVALGEAGAHGLRGPGALVPVADVDLDLAAPQAGRDLHLRQRHPLVLHLAQALRDLGLGDAEHPQRVGAQRGRALEHRRHLRRLQRRRPHRLQLARRAGQDDDDPLAVGHDEPGGRPDRVQRRRPLGDHRLLAVGRDHGLLVEFEAPARTRAGPRRSSPRPPRRGSSSRPQKRPTTSAVRSSAVGPSPPEVTIRSIPSAGEEAQRRLEVVGTVGDDEDVGDLDPELGQPFGDPGTVAIDDPAGDHLGAGDDDPRATRTPGRGACLSMILRHCEQRAALVRQVGLSASDGVRWPPGSIE